MNERREFELSDEQNMRLLDACQPTPYIVVGGIGPRSPRQNAEAMWDTLGHEMGFVGSTVRGIPHKGSRFFTAELNVTLAEFEAAGLRATERALAMPEVSPAIAIAGGPPGTAQTSLPEDFGERVENPGGEYVCDEHGEPLCDDRG